MTPRTGLPAEVPTREWCEKIHAIPALKEAGRNTTLVWADYHTADRVSWRLRQRADVNWPSCVPAWTVREMRSYANALPESENDLWNDRWVYLNDPDDLAKFLIEDARACIEAAS